MFIRENTSWALGYDYVQIGDQTIKWLIKKVKGRWLTRENNLYFQSHFKSQLIKVCSDVLKKQNTISWFIFSAVVWSTTGQRGECGGVSYTGKRGFKVTLYTSGPFWMLPPPPTPSRQIHPLTLPALSQSQMSLRPRALLIHKHWLRLSVSLDYETWQRAFFLFLLHHSCLPDWSYFWTEQYFVPLEYVALLWSICQQSRIRTRR